MQQFLKILMSNAGRFICLSLVFVGTFYGLMWSFGWLVSQGFAQVSAALIVISVLLVVTTIAASLVEWWPDRHIFREQEEVMSAIEKSIKDYQEKAARIPLPGGRERFIEQSEYQFLLTSFCHEWPSTNDTYGIDFRNWKDRLDDLVERGLDLTKPSNHFDILLSTVTRYVARNQLCADRANDKDLEANMRASLAFAIPYCLQASQECLQHLQDIQKSWSEGDTKSRGELSEAAEGETP